MTGHRSPADLDAVDRSTLPADGGPEFNRLIFTRSPYLLQHADNPVDWYPWGEEAFARARAEDRPVFLSIGYSTCHWCHVMAGESFADRDVAALLNRDYVAVKVDREERPDIDAVYMNACQLMTGRGGWPLTILLTPDRQPFFAATYLPRTARGGLPGLIELLERVARLWQEQRSLVTESGERLSAALRSLDSRPAAVAPLDERPLRQALGRWRESFDGHHGGFGGAPKFPTPHNLSLLWRLGTRLAAPDAAQMAAATLTAIRRGGIYDQLGHGLHRYAVDAAWTVPHFEKMLYDQALFILAALDAWQAGGDDHYAEMVRATAGYLLAGLRTAGGGFCCGEDADSEGEEGTFYLWRLDEVRDALPEELFALACRGYGFSEEGNFEGQNIPVMAADADELAGAYGISAEEAAARLEEVRRLLLARREQRIRPHRDDKVLAGWNGLAAGALARAGALLDEPEWLVAAAAALSFVEEHLVDAGGRLLRSWRGGAAAIPAFAEDYAWLAWGSSELYLARHDSRDLARALHWHGEMVRLFADGEDELWECGSDAEAVLGRGRGTVDGAIPAAGSVAALNMLRLGDLTGDLSLAERGERLLRRRLGRLGGHPEAHAQLLIALDYALGPRQQVVISVPGAASAARAFLTAVHDRFRPRTVTLVHAAGDEFLPRLTSLTTGRGPRDGQAVAWLCSDASCQPPAFSPQELAGLLERSGGRPL